MRLASLVLCVLLGACSEAPAGPATGASRHFRTWVYQLQGYSGGGLDAVAATGADLAVIDLSRDGGSDYFTRSEVDSLRKQGMTVLAYFEIGSIENYRPEYDTVVNQAPDLLLNGVPGWPGEYYVRYWDQRWWDLVVKGRLDQAAAAGFDGVYLDTTVAYDEIKLSTVPGETRASLAQKMVALIARVSAYGRSGGRNLLIVPQDAPELGYANFNDPTSGPNATYLSAIDGIGMEELFYKATDVACAQSWCADNLAAVQAIERAGKFVLAVDYAVQPAHRSDACARGEADGFAEYVTTVQLDQLSPLCP